MNRELQPLVSICMPAYNVARVLPEALASVLAQSYPRIEIILVDDGSTDGTQEVAQSIVNDRIRYIRNAKNLGGFQTMNKAVSLAHGDYIAIYHADDIYERAIVEKEVVFLECHPQIGAVFCLDHYIDDEGRIFGGTTLPRELRGREALGYQNIFPFLLRRKNVLLRCPTFMAPRKVLDVVGPFDADAYDVAADLDMWIRIARQFPIGILNERLMRYRVGKQQWSSRYKRLRTDEDLFFAIMDHYLEVDGWLPKLSRNDLEEYGFHRCDDETFRAANKLIQGDVSGAWDLLQRPYPWRSLLSSVRRRKLRVLLLRFLMRGALALGAVHAAARLLVRTEYGGQAP